ncbi:hypothetical protein GCM10011514_19880 [Emticicia aquatilis]|uniref:Outer membrane protein beta-barrel domain-containing protein n=1 Tax=Emticicia aquatilis TaxID=1537369 RepID=A0A917DQ55_9BACT|nr:hypothetical protein [Emticicia aquatilis]GGD55797.1 hypothetical protein GCM10011514_19880 [Emticicia aquatilis]
MKPTDDIRKLLSEKFENFEAEPQDASWEAIRFALDLKDKLETYEAEPQEESWGEIKFATDLSQKFENYEAEPQDDTWSKIQLATQLTAKFSDYEAEPTADSWEKIRAALPINESIPLSEKFKDYEAEPMADSWEKIRAAMPASEPVSLSEKFKNYEAEPQAATWENIQLATQLSSKFSNYEAEPTADSWEIIKAAITPEKERRVIAWPFAFRVGIAASIALLLGFGWLVYNNNQKEDLALPNDKNSKPTNSQILNGKEGLATSKSNETNKNATDKEAGNKKINASKPTVIEQSTDLSGIASNGKTKNRKDSNSKSLEKASTENQVAKVIRKKEKRSLRNNLENSSSTESIVQNNKNTTSPTNTTQNGSESSVASNINPSNQANNIELNLLDSKEFKQTNIRLPFGEIAYNNEVPMEEPEVRVRRKMILTSSIMPLQTYQALTILPQTSTYIQQVGSLNALDAQRLGVQARVGVMQPLSNRFSTGVSLAYAGIRQAVSYEVNNGTYDVDLTSSTYTLVGVGETVSQNKFLHTLGLKLDNSYLVSNKKNKVFVLGGAEAVRVLNNNQYAYYLNASVALAYPMKGGKTVWIEPTYRYSLSQSLDANSYMQIRPSNIGLNVRVNFM